MIVILMNNTINARSSNSNTRLVLGIAHQGNPFLFFGGEGGVVASLSAGFGKASISFGGKGIHTRFGVTSLALSRGWGNGSL